MFKDSVLDTQPEVGTIICGNVLDWVHVGEPHESRPA